jgi:hypothetical protein
MAVTLADYIAHLEAEQAAAFDSGDEKRILAACDRLNHADSFNC